MHTFRGLTFYVYLYECRIAQILFNYITCIIYQLKYIIHQLFVLSTNLFVLSTNSYVLSTKICIIYQIEYIIHQLHVLSTNSNFIIHQLWSLRFGNAGSASCGWCTNWSLSRLCGIWNKLSSEHSVDNGTGASIRLKVHISVHKKGVVFMYTSRLCESIYYVYSLWKGLNIYISYIIHLLYVESLSKLESKRGNWLLPYWEQVMFLFPRHFLTSSVDHPYLITGFSILNI